MAQSLKPRTFWYWLVVFIALTALAPAWGQEVEAALSTDRVAVGEPVELRILATGGAQARLLDEFSVEGLIVASNAEQVGMQMSFPTFRREVQTRWTLTLVATREGRFSIPPLRVQVDGKVFKTLPSVLNVSGQSGSSIGGIPVRPATPVTPPGSNPRISPPTAQATPNQATPQRNLPQPPGSFTPRSTQERWFGELVVPKAEAFVGEVIPVDLRFYVEANTPVMFGDRPSFSGEGFTVYRTSEPSEITQDIRGVPYSCIIYRTAITAAKAGELEIPPASVMARVQLPTRLPRGIDPFMRQMLQQMGGEVRDIEIETEPSRIIVNPLPTKDRPETFRGAIGEFEMKTSVSTESAEPGEPVTLRVEISGRGNFEAMGPPVLAEDPGWRVYEPTSEFEASPSDPIGFNGTKTYEFTLLAREDRKATPEVFFSFFDPVDERYVTRAGAPVKINAPGSAGVSAPQPTVANPDTTIEPDSPEPEPLTRTGGELSRDFRASSFHPAAWASGLIIAALVLGLVWVAVLAGFKWKQYTESPAAQ